jgi:general secretion pathway protein F/type IV pilus assembly protein PilC
MIGAGEAAGALNIVLERLSHFLTRQQKLKKEISTAMIYPGILFCFAFVVICLLLGFVVPSIEGIFADRKLNGFTNFVLGASHVFRYYWWIYLPLIAAIIAFFYYHSKRPQSREWFQRQMMKIPLVNTLMVQAAMTRFCRTMGTLQQGGLPMIDSLRLAREVMQNPILEEEIRRAEIRVIEGSSLSVELMRTRWIPRMVSRMLAVGEETGSIVTLLNKIADIYEEELDKTIARIMALSQPVILIFMGGIVGTVLMAILLPLTDISSLNMNAK